tara:strand:- start:105 stop:518 length:414 start_codon:yes stop_codon:yes gene_type:complete
VTATPTEPQTEPQIGFFAKWWAFFRPVEGWEGRYRSYRGGRNVWEVPGKENCPKLTPFPLQWVPHRLELTDDDTPQAHHRGFELTVITCTDSGRVESGTLATLCCRCGVPLHSSRGHQNSPFDAPSCKRCRWIVRLA